VGSRAMNVDQRRQIDSMILGQEGCSIASRTALHCKQLDFTAEADGLPGSNGEIMQSFA
jgi:hypothetical protein